LTLKEEAPAFRPGGVTSKLIKDNTIEEVLAEFEKELLKC